VTAANPNPLIYTDSGEDVASVPFLRPDPAHRYDGTFGAWFEGELIYVRLDESRRTSPQDPPVYVDADGTEYVAKQTGSGEVELKPLG
jgi:hypothetical protein